MEIYTQSLTSLWVAYRWGFPFKLLIDYKGQTVVLKTLQQTKNFESELEKEAIEVMVLNQDTEEFDQEKGTP